MAVPATLLITPKSLAERLADPGCIVLDCRFVLSDPGAGEKAYAEGHVPGAYYAHLERDLSGPLAPDLGRHPLPSRDAFQRTLETWGMSQGTQVVAYDAGSSVFASRLWWLLSVWWGHPTVAVLDGGLKAWQQEGHPVSAAPQAPRKPSSYPPPGRTGGLWLDSGAVWDDLKAGSSRLLVDARGRDRYRGISESLDPVAGHIPGAVNHPFEHNLGPDATFRSPEALRANFTDLLAGRSAEDVVHYCGSGVSACQNVLAMAVAGLGLTRLYPGSWSAWVSDTARPVVRETETRE